MRARARFFAFAVVAAALLAAVAPARAVPSAGWIPNTLLVPPFPSTSGPRPSWFHTTRRVVPQERVPGRFLLGHALFGLWESEPGFGWSPLTPHCLSIVGAQLIDPQNLPGCGVEGIALDESSVTGALTAYVSTYNIDLLAPGTPIAPGGVFKAEIKLGSRGVGTAGILWRPLLTGVRGNALMVRRTGTAPATIVAGRIQKNGSDVGTDTNAWCSPGCQPSVYISADDGATWATRTFTGSPCSAAVGTSSRLVGALDYDRQNPNVFYAAANSGLWVSPDSGNTWTYAFYSCGDAPGFALTRQTPSSSGRVYVGQNTDAGQTSEIWVATNGPTGTSAFAPLSLRDASSGAAMSLSGWTQSIMIDKRDPTERTLFVAAWRNASPTGGGQGGVYKVVDQGNGTATVTDLKASFLEPYRDCLGLAPGCLSSLPYPLVFNPLWRPSLFLAQHPLLPDLLYASSVYGGVWTRSDGTGLL